MYRVVDCTNENGVLEIVVEGSDPRETADVVGCREAALAHARGFHAVPIVVSQRVKRAGASLHGDDHAWVAVGPDPKLQRVFRVAGKT